MPRLSGSLSGPYRCTMTRSDMVNLMAMLTRAGIDFSARFNIPSTVRVVVDGGVWCSFSTVMTMSWLV